MPFLLWVNFLFLGSSKVKTAVRRIRKTEGKVIFRKAMKSEEAVSDSGSDRENKPLPTTGENNSHCKKEEDVVKPKRKYSGWSVEEVDAFFIGIATHGCDFEKLTKVPLLNKNYEQVDSLCIFTPEKYRLHFRHRSGTTTTV